MSLTSQQTLNGLPNRRNSLALRQLSCSVALLLGASLTPIAANAQSAGAFPTCDATAYLTHGHLSRTIAVDLQSGDYKIAAEFHENQIDPPFAWTNQASLDALGFNPNDGFVYGWSQFHHLPVRVHSDWSVEPINVETNDQRHFYVGDVSNPENKLYMYNRNGNNSGLYSVDLDPSSPDHLSMKLVIPSSTLSLNVEDFAIHPFSGLIYAVEADGNVVEVNPQTGVRTVLGNSQVFGNLGSAFFDGDGNLYVARNHDGKIFRIGIDSGNYLGEHIATGPSASAADGFRCATAPFAVTTAQLDDFGDAPNSYGTSLDTDGARHGVAGADPLRLGQWVDGEVDAYAFPLDDNRDGEDEDSVSFLTSFVSGQTTRVAVEASGEGFLSAWVDTDRDGVFDPQDQVVTDQVVTAGSNMVFIPVSADSSAGDTWSRFRLSSTPGLQATGPAVDGEVEDHLVSLLEEPTTVSTYPSQNGWSTVAFEDNWPFVGDYDMNDLVVRMRTQTQKTSNGVSQVNIEGYIAAAGALYKNGFAIRLPGVPRDAIDESKLEFALSDMAVEQSPLEAGRDEAIFIITENVFQHVTPGPSCDYYRTEFQCGADLEFKFSLTIPFKEAQQVELSGVFDPFLFASPGEFHGEHFVRPPGRSYEIHLKNQSPTEAFDSSLFAGVGQDASNASQGEYFLTETGMPWALEVGTEWQYPYEFVEISAAYPDFPAFAISSGTQNQDWFLEENAVVDLIFPE